MTHYSATPDWELPDGVDRGLWEYVNSADIAANYDGPVRESPLAQADIRFCEQVFEQPGRLADLGCGTGRLCIHFASKGHDCVGVDLSPSMLEVARRNAESVGASVEWFLANLTDLNGLSDQSFRYAACLFSTLGMIRGSNHRAAAVRNAFRILEPGGRLVLHVHNRWFAGLGWRRLLGQVWHSAVWSATAGDIPSPRTAAGAPLVLHHFTLKEATGILSGAGFRVTTVRPVGTSGAPVGSTWPTRVYGYLIAADRPEK